MRTTKIQRRIATIGAAIALVAVPIAAYAGSVFNDVEDDAVHIDGITWVKDTGVSVGCDSNNNFCPDDFVSRKQMGTFMYRLSGNDPATSPSVNADKVDGLDADQLSSGIAYPGDAFLSLTGGVELIESVEIAVPTDGYVLVMGTATVFSQHANGTGDTARIGLSDSATTLANSNDVFLPSDLADGFYGLGWADQNVFPVAAGTHTFYLLGEEQQGSIGVGGKMTALFVPAAYGTVENS